MERETHFMLIPSLPVTLTPRPPGPGFVRLGTDGVGFPLSHSVGVGTIHSYSAESVSEPLTDGNRAVGSILEHAASRLRQTASSSVSSDFQSPPPSFAGGSSRRPSCGDTRLVGLGRAEAR